MATARQRALNQLLNRGHSAKFRRTAESRSNKKFKFKRRSPPKSPDCVRAQMQSIFFMLLLLNLCTLILDPNMDKLRPQGCRGAYRLATRPGGPVTSCHRVSVGGVVGWSTARRQRITGPRWPDGPLKIQKNSSTKALGDKKRTLAGGRPFSFQYSDPEIKRAHDIAIGSVCGKNPCNRYSAVVGSAVGVAAEAQSAFIWERSADLGAMASATERALSVTGAVVMRWQSDG
jgi:hypothetical protein